MNIQASKTSVIIICSATAVFSIGFWIKYKKSKKLKSTIIKESYVAEEDQVPQVSDTTDHIAEDDVLELNDAKKKELERIIPKDWKKVGQINELFIYPLKSGRGKSLKESVFTDYGIRTLSEGQYPLRDRMFLVYKEETGEFKTGKNYPTLVLVTLSAVDEIQVKLEAVGMPFLTFKVPEKTEQNLLPIPCTLWWGEAFECIDCGSEVARWISRFLIGTNSGIRLGCTVAKTIKNFEPEPWEKFNNVFDTLRENGAGLSSDLASFMLMSESSVQELNQKLDRPGPALQFRPNAVVSGPEAFAEDNWEWIKIGKDVVIRNVKPYLSFEEQRDPHRVKANGKSPTMGIYCGLYKSGIVKVGDDVFIHAVTKKLENGDPKFESERFPSLEVKINGQDSVGNGLT